MVCKWFALGSKNKHKVHSLRLHVHLVEYWASYLLVYVLSLFQMCTNLKTDPWNRRITCRRIKHNTLTFCSLNYKYLYVHFVRWRRRTGMQIIPAPTRMSEDCTARAGNINGVSILWGRTEEEILHFISLERVYVFLLHPDSVSLAPRRSISSA